MKECTCTIDIGCGQSDCCDARIVSCELCKAAPKMLETLKRLTSMLMFVPRVQKTPVFREACDVIEEAMK